MFFDTTELKKVTREALKNLGEDLKFTGSFRKEVIKKYYKDDLTFLFNLAGTPKEEVTIGIEENVLVIKVKDTVVHEVFIVDPIGNNYDYKEVTASYIEGLLTVKFEKQKPEKPKSRIVEIQ